MYCDACQQIECFLGPTRCGCCSSKFCHTCYVAHWHGQMPLYVVFARGKEFVFRHKDEADYHEQSYSQIVVDTPIVVCRTIRYLTAEEWQAIYQGTFPVNRLTH